MRGVRVTSTGGEPVKSAALPVCQIIVIAVAGVGAHLPSPLPIQAPNKCPPFDAMFSTFFRQSVVQSVVHVCVYFLLVARRQTFHPNVFFFSLRMRWIVCLCYLVPEQQHRSANSEHRTATG